MLIIGTELFRERPFANEAELEEFVEKNSRLLFGDDTIYLSKKMVVRTGEGRATIPDAFVVDYVNEQWYLVEVELISHGVWRHIVPQITNQMVACLNQETRNLLIDRVLEHIDNDQKLSQERGLPQRVLSILLKEPAIAIPIDGSSGDLEAWARTQKLTVSVWEIQKFESTSEPSRIAYQIPNDNEPSIVASPLNKTIAPVRRASAKNLALLIEGNLLTDGDELTLSYRGKQFKGTARPTGIQLADGNVYSPSDAAIRCYATAGATRPTENGWRVWKRSDGRTLNDLFDTLPTAD